jgi:hypothetical protein
VGYRAPGVEATIGTAAGKAKAQAEGDALLPLSKEASEIQAYIRRPHEARKPVGYNRAFLDSYRPGESFYPRGTFMRNNLFFQKVRNRVSTM